MNRIFKSPVIAGLFYFFPLFLACDLGSSRYASKPVMRVNDHSLSAKEFAGLLARRLKNFDALAAKDPANVSRAKDDILRAFMIQSLFADYAKQVGLDVEESELQREVHEFRSSYPDDLSFRRVLADEGLSASDWQEDLRRTLLQRKVFKKIAERVPEPSVEDVKRQYESDRELYKRKDRVYLRQIVLDELSKAQSVREELKRRDFVEIAKKYSIAPEGKVGGLVGWTERGAVDVFEKAFSLPIGGIGPVLESRYGFHIFKVERKATGGYATLDEVRPIVAQAIRGKKEQAEFSSWLDKQIRSSRVLKDAALIEAVSVETRSK